MDTWGWGGTDDDIELDLSSQRVRYCLTCPVQMFCNGGIWPDDITVCKACNTHLRGNERLVRCGRSTLKNRAKWHGWRAACNCRRAWPDPGHRGCDGLELT